ncbi:hypothetical protein DS62_06040 [Smithella sp. SC_K08D17]|jgi:hypothetical protein|nr:hypothetical protein KD27_01545 [Smithella sp. D17]KIE17144.1 hypothetical protein DS62_06040 [Smithella sp. SC_K08D17]MDD5343633.1 hypothetical protein [Smithella sp.]MDD5524096.1 hypothetical protein [Smithella sp.]
MRKYLILILLVFICACGSTQQLPDLKDTAFRNFESYKTNFLNGREGVSEPHFNKAKQALSDGNDLYLLAKIYLTKYALHTAVLEDFDNSEFVRINQLQPSESNFAYYNFLNGNFAAAEDNLLPSNYRGFIKAARDKDLAKAVGEIKSISDPLSRLIASGILVKYMSYDEKILQSAINTSAGNGWRRPLWAYLTKLHKYYLDSGETVKAKSTKERLDLLKK